MASKKKIHRKVRVEFMGSLEVIVDANPYDPKGDEAWINAIGAALARVPAKEWKEAALLTGHQIIGVESGA